MKAEISRDGLLVLSPSTQTEEYALQSFLKAKEMQAVDGMPALPLDFIFVDECDD